MSNLSPSNHTNNFVKNGRVHNAVLGLLLVLGIAAIVLLYTHTKEVREFLNHYLMDQEISVSQDDVNYVSSKLTTPSPMSIRSSQFLEAAVPTSVSEVPMPKGMLALTIRGAVAARFDPDTQMQELWRTYCSVEHKYDLYGRTTPFGVAEDDSLSEPIEAAQQAAQLYEVIISQMIAEGHEFPQSGDGWPEPKLFPFAVEERCGV